jgi:hypothetical protein
MARTADRSFPNKIIGGILAVTLVLVGCGRGKTIAVDGEAVPVTRFNKAVAALCLARQQARTDSTAARRTYFRDADEAIGLAVRALGDDRRQAAASLTDARERVTTDFAERPAPATLFADLGTLTEALRAGLARVAIPTRPCDI